MGIRPKTRAVAAVLTLSTDRIVSILGTTSASRVLYSLLAGCPEVCAEDVRKVVAAESGFVASWYRLGRRVKSGEFGDPPAAVRAADLRGLAAKGAFSPGGIACLWAYHLGLGIAP